MHAKSYSEGTSYDRKTAAYYVQSPPSNYDAAEKLSYVSGSPTPQHHRHYYNHSREYSGSRSSDHSLKQYPQINIGYQSLHHGRRYQDGDGDDYDDEMDSGDRRGSGSRFRVYACVFVSFVLLFTAFCLILWGASKSYSPIVSLKGLVFEDFNVQAGIDQSGFQTNLLSMNSTVRIFYRNPATFFAVHVTSTPVELWYFQLRLASGKIEKFRQSRKSQRTIVTEVQSYEVPLYGGVPMLMSGREDRKRVVLPLNVTFTMRSRAFILGKLVKSTFHTRIMCSIVLRGNKLGKNVVLNNKLCSNFG